MHCGTTLTLAVNSFQRYKMPKGKEMPFIGGDSSIRTLQWHVGGGNYFTTTNNAPGSGGWFGVSCHSWSAFRGLATAKRCQRRSDFATNFGGNNGDYKMDHAGNHGGTTRCKHGITSIGVGHWIRLCTDLKYLAKGEVKAKC